MLYVDTSVFVALLTREHKTNEVNTWYSNCRQILATSEWCVTEFASAMALKLRTGQLTDQLSQQAWDKFQMLCKRDISLLPADSTLFHQAGLTILSPAIKNLRAGDALHLLVARENKSQGVVSLDAGLLKNAALLNIKPVAL